MHPPPRARPPTLFPKPEWPLLPDPEGPRPYANVDNRLEVISRYGETYEVALAVPTAFFTLMRDTLKITPEERVTLAVEFEDRGYLFSALTDTDRLFDLWYYTPSMLPAWLKDPAYTLGAHATAYRQCADTSDA